MLEREIYICKIKSMRDMLMRDDKFITETDYHKNQINLDSWQFSHLIE